MNRLIVTLLLGALAATLCQANSFHHRHHRRLSKMEDEQADSKLAQALAEEVGYDPRDPQQDISNFFNGFVSTIFKGVCSPICQGYKGCRMSALMQPNQFDAEACEMHLLSMPCKCTFAVSFIPGTGKVDMSGRPAGSMIPTASFGNQGQYQFPDPKLPMMEPAHQKRGVFSHYHNNNL